VAGSKVRCRVESRAVAELLARLAGLDRKVARKALRKGLTEATRVVMWDARALVPKRTGTLRKSIGRKVWTKRGGAVIAGIIGPRKGFRVLVRGRPVNPVRYAHLVEFGRRAVVAKKKATGAAGVLSEGKGGEVFGPRVASAAPRPFMRPAWERNKDRIVAVLVRELENGVRLYYARRASGA
jgi:HK97 gp10 family phage protein